MSGVTREATGVLIGRLGTELRPVRRLAGPVWRAAAWLGVVLLGAALVAMRVDMEPVAARLAARPDMWLAAVGSVTTAVAGALAVMMLALPDRDARWALLPLPPALLWLGASGMGCARQDAIALLHPASMGQAANECLPFILGASLLLALPLGVLLWRARPLRPGLVAWTGGLAVAAAAASLLWLCHPFDASLADLIVHAAAIGLVMLGCRIVALLLPE